MKIINQQLAFVRELEKLKAVYRQTTVISDGNRYENTAEHSWHVALTACILREYAAASVDISRVVKMLLIHDVVEIDAGDTFAFAGQQAMDNQALKEKKAADRLFGLLPEAQFRSMQQLWLEFEAAETEDAKFARAMDRILPLIQNMENNGGSWSIHSVTKSQVLERNQYVAESAPGLWQYVCEQIEIAVQNGWLRDS